MVVVLPVVEADELLLEESSDLLGRRVDRANNLIRSLALPADDEEVWKYLAVEEHEVPTHTVVVIGIRLGLLGA